MKNSIPISLDKYLNYTETLFSEIDLEIKKVTKKIKPIYVGMGEENCLDIVQQEKDKDWSVWVLVEDTIFGDSNYYAARKWNAMALRLFPKLVNFIENLPIEAVGRVMIMGIDANKTVTTHIDTQFLAGAPAIPEYDRLLNICFGDKKHMYRYNPNTKKKDYYTGRINWIDVSDWHGIDPSPTFTYSVRVDAKLNNKFRELLKQTYNV